MPLIRRIPKRDLGALGKLAQVANVHHLCGLLERVCEAALRDTADEGHLAAFESGADLAALARGLSLAAPSRRLADPRARPPPLADARPVRPGRPVEAR